MLNPGAIISKLIAIIMFCISFVIPASPDNMDISVEVIKSEDQKIIIEWQNNTRKAITEPTYYIEKFENEEWISVPFADGFGFPEIYTQYYPTEKGKITVNVQRDLKEPLSEGIYRITLCYDLLYCKNADGKASAEFTVA